LLIGLPAVKWEDSFFQRLIKHKLELLSIADLQLMGEYRPGESLQGVLVSVSQPQKQRTMAPEINQIDCTAMYVYR
jgi:hypothetical protein